MRQPHEPVLVEAKLRRPQAFDNAVERPALVRRLDAAPPGALRLVVAPAGCGKSQLIAQWLQGRDGHVAYIAVDRSDRDPTRFWLHLLTSIGRCGIDVHDLVQTLRTPSLPLIAEIVEPLTGRLGELPLTVVVEDLHLVSTVDLVESIEAFIDAAPLSVTIAVVARTDPPLHVPRRRVAGRLTEVRTDDLSLSTAEGQILIGHALDADPGTAVAETLVARTEGWPAGLYMAALALRTAADPAAFVERFAGDDRMVSEYLSTEVSTMLGDDECRFLRRTAVLDELDSATCQELLGDEDSTCVLGDVVRTNLFLVPTDDHGRTYRYHQLFRAWLLAELDRREPGARTKLHRRAAAIYRARRDPRTAVDHALAAGDHAFARSVAYGAAEELLLNGALATLSYWVDAIELPNDDGLRLSEAVLRAWIAITEGDIDAVQRWCDVARRHLVVIDQEEAAKRRSGDLPVLTAYAHLLQGSPTKALEQLEDVEPLSPAEPPDAAITWIGAAAEYWLGSADGRIFTAAGDAANKSGDTLASILAGGFLANTKLDDGDPTGALDCIDTTFEIARSAGVESFGHMAIAHVARARWSLEAGRAEGAVRDCERAIELASRRGDRPVGLLAQLILAQACHLAGAPDAAALLRRAENELADLPEAIALAERARVVAGQLRLPPPICPPPLEAPLAPLTDRELALLRLLPGTLNQRELGETLNVSFNTVKSHTRQIYRKLGVSSRSEAVASARRLGLLRSGVPQ